MAKIQKTDNKYVVRMQSNRSLLAFIADGSTECYFGNNVL